MMLALAGSVQFENCELILTCGPHLPGTVPFTGSVAVPPWRDLLMHDYAVKLHDKVLKIKIFKKDMNRTKPS